MSNALGRTDTISADDVMPDSSRRPPGSLVKHHDLVRWLIQQGGSIHPDIVIAYQPGKGYHAIVGPGKHVGKDTQIATCPLATTLCCLNALDISPFTCRGTRFPRRFLDRYSTTPEVLQTFFLMEQQLLGEKSWWVKYITTLPSPEDIKDLQFESPNDRRWIHGTNLEGALELQLRKWHENYDEGVDILKQCGWENAKNGRLSWELFRWAITIFGTRSFTSQVLSDSTPADTARPLGREDPSHEMLSKLFSERFAVLLPVLDILNHRPAAQIEWQARHNFVGLQVLEPYSEGQELYNNYGPRDNESLLLSYGFVLEDNPFDHLVVSIRLSEDSPLMDVRGWPRDPRSNEQFNCYIFAPGHPIVADGSHLERAFFSYDLLDSISVLTGNDRELGLMYNNQKTIMSMFLPDQFLDFHNLLGAISQLLQDVRARAGRLQMTDPTQDGQVQPATQKQKYAQQYRNSQLRILQNAIAVCAFVILRACTDMRERDIILTMQVKIPQFYSPDIDANVRRLTCLTRQHELLTVNEIVRLTASPVMGTLQTCVQQITKALQVADHLPSNHSDTIKAGFAIVMSAVCCEFQQSSALLRPRLSSWLEELTQWYPPDDENWAYVPHSGPYAPGEQPPTALVRLLSVVEPIVNIVQIQSGSNSRVQQWLRPEMICWGWNVMEEEGVRVPVEIERFCNGIIDAAMEDGAIGFLMYCKQY